MREARQWIRWASLFYHGHQGHFFLGLQNIFSDIESYMSWLFNSRCDHQTTQIILIWSTMNHAFDPTKARTAP
jgi:hypothetical protein